MNSVLISYFTWLFVCISLVLQRTMTLFSQKARTKKAIVIPQINAMAMKLTERRVKTYRASHPNIFDTLIHTFQKQMFLIPFAAIAQQTEKRSMLSRRLPTKRAPCNSRRAPVEDRKIHGEFIFIRSILNIQPNSWYNNL